MKPEGTAFAAQTIDVWHQRLGHVADSVHGMDMSGCVDGLDLVGSKHKACDECHFGKQPSNPHPKRKEIRKCLPGQRFHADVCFATTTSLGGATRFLTFKDEASGYRMVKFLRSTKEVSGALKSMLDEAEKQTGQKAVSIRTDNGTEFTNESVAKLLGNIIHEKSPPNVKQANGIAERENRILCDTARSMLFNADLTRVERNLLWAEAVYTAAYIRNRLPNNRTGSDVTPHELWFGTKPDVSHLRVFGSAAFVRIPESKRKKFDPKSRKTVFIGYDWLTTKIFRVFNREKRQTELVSDVQVEELDSNCQKLFPEVERTIGPVTQKSIEIPLEESEADEDRDEQENETDDGEEVEDQRRKDDRAEEDASETDDHHDEDDLFKDASADLLPHHPVQKPNPQPVIKRTQLRPLGSKVKPNSAQIQHQMKTRSKESLKYAMSVALDPTSVDDMMSRQDSDEWRKAQDEEMQSLKANKTWSLVHLPPGRNVVTNKWIFKSKTNPDGTLKKRKARLVARGFSQTAGIDFFETFAPVVRYESVRCILSLAAAHDMTIHQFDVKTAFLNGKLDEVVFMQQPEGYEDGTNRVCRLNRSLYGLKQSPRNWNARFNEFLEAEGFAATPEDACVYTRTRGQDVTIVCLYVDDGLVCGTRKETTGSFIRKLRKTFDVTVNEPDCYVGMEVKRNREARTISISQSGYISRMLERFGLSDAKTVVSPMEPSVNLVVEDSPDATSCPYREAIGCLNYLSLISRPDITYAVSTLARFNDKPQMVHWNAVKRVMRYLRGTSDYSITYGGSEEVELTGYCDSDWGRDESQRRSTSGYVFTLNSGPVAWSSRLQKTSALSVTEAEYVSLAEALKECLWLRPFLASLGHESDDATTIKVDNQAAIALSRNPEFHKRTKHVGIRYHRIRQEQEAGVVAVDYVQTEQNPADILTKGVSSKQLTRCLRLINVLGHGHDR